MSVLNEDDSFLVTDLRDNGPGVDPMLKDEIFEPFFTTKSSSGTGLGLSTTRQIVNAHGGELTLQTSDNSMTVFRVKLPYITEDR